MDMATTQKRRERLQAGDGSLGRVAPRPQAVPCPAQSMGDHMWGFLGQEVMACPDV